MTAVVTKTRLAPSRRHVLALACATGASAVLPARAASAMPTRAIPKSGEALPVIGLGSSKAVSQMGTDGPGPLTEVLRTLVGHGGKVVDTWPRNPENDARFGGILGTPELRTLFVTSKIDRVGKEQGLAQFREAQKAYNRKTIDLMQIFSLTDLAVHWPTLRAIKDAGEARYIGVTVSEDKLHDQLAAFLGKEAPDTVQVNYSITERKAEARLLPLAQERGVAVLINRPFMNGAYFSKLQGRPLPTWAAELDCKTWAEFSLKYILAHPAVTCVLTETANPKHMAENALAASGRLPDAALRARMTAYMDEVL
jgi:diketogulonate reductase-like aldo/keto reductase